MSDLPALVDEYMGFRAARGFQPSARNERLLRQFVDSLPDSRDDGLIFSNRDALTWANAPDGVKSSWVSDRLSVVRQFGYYLVGSGLPVSIPAHRQLPVADRRAIPYLYSDADVQALMSASDQLFTALRAATMKTLVGLLAVTGMRIGETLRLSISDLDAEQGILTITHAKFDRQRIVCLDPSSCEALLAYLDFAPRWRLGTGKDRPLFTTSRGTAISYRTVSEAFRQMVQHVGLTPRAGARPRLHDLRHSFATRTMIDAYQSGLDPARIFAALSIWLGHSNPADTYWYLQAAPEVAAIAAGRLEHNEES